MGACTCIKDIGLVDCSGLGLNSVPTEFPPEIKYLSLSDNDIIAVPDGVLSYLSELLELDLSGNHILELTNGSLNGLSKLQKLNLDGNSLQSLSNSILDPVRSSLEYLDLSRNAISSELIIDVENLISLKLTSNQIQSLDTFDFSQLRKLEALYLDKNTIQNLKVNGANFAGLVNLKSLNLNQNFFRYVPLASSFNAFRNTLEHLSLFNNFLLSSVSNRELPFLKTYNLSYCGIDVLDNQTFIGMPRLTTIDLTGNILDTVSPEAFDGLASLDTLRLSVSGFLSS